MCRINGLGMIIVTYRPNLTNFFPRLEEYSKAVERIVVVDNSEQTFLQKVFSSKEFCQYANVTWIFNGENLGISKAQNIGIKKILSLSSTYKKIMFMDQDNFLNSKEIKRLDGDLSSSGSSVAMVGPGFQYHEHTLETVSELISSGSIVKVPILLKVGLFQEDYFIDFVDFDWSWKAANMGYKSMVDNAVILQRNLDNQYPERKGGRIASPFRFYYMNRNLLYSLRKDATSTRMVFHWIKSYLKRAKFQIIHDDVYSRRKQLKAFLLGTFDGLRGKLGKATYKFGVVKSESHEK